MGVEVSLETPLALAAAPLAFPGSEAVNEAYALVQTQESLVAAAMQQRAHIAEQLLKLSEAAAAADAAAASVKGGKGGKGGAAPPVAAEPAADEPSKSAEELQAELDAVDQTLGPLEAELQRLRGKALATWSTTVAEAMQHDVATRANMYADGLRDSLDWLNQQRYGALERKMSSMHPPASTVGSMGWSVQLSGRRVPHYATPLSPRAPALSPRARSPRAAFFDAIATNGTTGADTSAPASPPSSVKVHWYGGACLSQSAPAVLALPPANDAVHSRSDSSSIGASPLSPFMTPRLSSASPSAMRVSFGSSRGSAMRDGSSLGPVSPRQGSTSHSSTRGSTAAGSPRDGSPKLTPLALHAALLQPGGTLTNETYEHVQTAYLKWKKDMSRTLHSNLARVPYESILRHVPTVKAQPLEYTFSHRIHHAPGAGPLRLFAIQPRLDEPVERPAGPRIELPFGAGANTSSPRSSPRSLRHDTASATARETIAVAANDDQANRAYSQMDTFADGKVSKSEYLESAKGKTDRYRAKAAFDQLDANKDGLLSADEFKAGALRKMAASRG